MSWKGTRVNGAALNHTYAQRTLVDTEIRQIHGIDSNGNLINAECTQRRSVILMCQQMQITRFGQAARLLSSLAANRNG